MRDMGPKGRNNSCKSASLVSSDKLVTRTVGRSSTRGQYNILYYNLKNTSSTTAIQTTRRRSKSRVFGMGRYIYVFAVTVSSGRCNLCCVCWYHSRFCVSKRIIWSVNMRERRRHVKGREYRRTMKKSRNNGYIWQEGI